MTSSTSFLHYNIYNKPYTSTNTTTIPTNEFALYEPAIYQQALALLQQSGGLTSSNPVSNPDTTTQYPTQSPLRGSEGTRHDSAVATAAAGVSAQDWQTPMYQSQNYNSMTGSVAQQQHRGIKRSRSHQRTPSASTVASNGPASPYMHNRSYPHIANTDTSPDQTAFYTDQVLFPKNLPTPSQTPTDSGFANVASLPSQTAHMSNAHYAMKGFGIDHHTEDYLSDFAPSRQSMSSYGNDSPATPQSGNGDVDTRQYNMPSNDYRPNVQLFRTESQAYQDEMYNPNTVYTSAPAKTSNANSYLSPHRNLITERLQTANMARSVSPASAVSRERSPFRANSPLAGPVDDWKPQNGIPTAQALRQQQQQEAAQKEVQRATLRREPTKTISPKDALLDYTAEGDAPLFSDNIPEGYERHFGGTEQWPNNNYLSQTSNFGDLAATGQQNMSFRHATSADNGYSGTTFDFPNGLPQGGDLNKNNPFATNYQAAVAAQMNQYSEPTPDFPASIPSMETSHSDAGLPASSQETDANGPTSIPQRPDDTRANTGTYTCTYHGCAQRFHSHNDLQKHKREYHRSQQQIKADTTSPSATGSTSPRSSESPGPSTAGMTSAQILARNSQAGPHKCTRINPSTNKPCNTVFSRPYDLTRHEDTIHNGRKQKVRCPMCREEKTFSRNDALTRHMRVVHPEVESFGKRGRRGD